MARPKKTTTVTDTSEKKPRATRKAKAPLTTRENLSALIGTAMTLLKKPGQA